MSSDDRNARVEALRAAWSNLNQLYRWEQHSALLSAFKGFPAPIDLPIGASPVTPSRASAVDETSIAQDRANSEDSVTEDEYDHDTRSQLDSDTEDEPTDDRDSTLSVAPAGDGVARRLFVQDEEEQTSEDGDEDTEDDADENANLAGFVVDDDESGTDSEGSFTDDETDSERDCEVVVQIPAEQKPHPVVEAPAVQRAESPERRVSTPAAKSRIPVLSKTPIAQQLHSRPATSVAEVTERLRHMDLTPASKPKPKPKTPSAIPKTPSAYPKTPSLAARAPSAIPRATTTPASIRKIGASPKTVNRDIKPPVSPSSQERARRLFVKTREEVAARLFAELDRKVFDGKLHEVKLEWSKTLRTTAGTYTNKPGMGTITLSTKVIDSEARLKSTMLHEMCHAAVAVINNEPNAPAHGALFKQWGRRVEYHCPGVTVDTLHNYIIHHKYIYKCTRCGLTYGRESKSIDTNVSVCRCGGRLVLQPRLTSAGKPAEPKAPTGFSAFVKENMAKFRKDNPGTPHKAIMGKMAELYKAKKTASAVSENPS
eukprot:m51a1_g2725 hypothetical protein (542) ;mRNA; f:865474-867450